MVVAKYLGRGGERPWLSQVIFVHPKWRYNLLRIISWSISFRFNFVCPIIWTLKFHTFVVKEPSIPRRDCPLLARPIFMSTFHNLDWPWDASTPWGTLETRRNGRVWLYSARKNEWHTKYQSLWCLIAIYSIKFTNTYLHKFMWTPQTPQKINFLSERLLSWFLAQWSCDHRRFTLFKNGGHHERILSESV